VVYEILAREFRFMDRDLQARLDIGEFIFTRDDFIREAGTRGVSLDALLADLTSTNQVRERQFTYVKGHEFGKVPDAVRAHFRYRLSTAASPQESSSPGAAVDTETGVSAGTTPGR
jgi:hypothetical protein